MKRRFGRFSVTTDVVEDETEAFAGILAEMEFVPLRVERRYDNYSFEYIGFSPMFAELEEGMLCPQYELKVRRVEINENEYEVLLESLEPVRHSMIM